MNLVREMVPALAFLAPSLWPLLMALAWPFAHMSPEGERYPRSHSLPFIEMFPKGNRAQAGGSKFHDPARDPSAYRKQAQQLGTCKNLQSSFFLKFIDNALLRQHAPLRNMCRLACAG